MTLDERWNNVATLTLGIVSSLSESDIEVDHFVDGSVSQAHDIVFVVFLTCNVSSWVLTVCNNKSCIVNDVGGISENIDSTVIDWCTDMDVWWEVCRWVGNVWITLIDFSCIPMVCCTCWIISLAFEIDLPCSVVVDSILSLIQGGFVEKDS